MEGARELWNMPMTFGMTMCYVVGFMIIRDCIAKPLMRWLWKCREWRSEQEFKEDEG